MILGIVCRYIVAASVLNYHEEANEGNKSKRKKRERIKMVSFNNKEKDMMMMMIIIICVVLYIIIIYSNIKEWSYIGNRQYVIITTAIVFSCCCISYRRYDVSADYIDSATGNSSIYFFRSVIKLSIAIFKCNEH